MRLTCLAVLFAFLVVACANRPVSTTTVMDEGVAPVSPTTVVDEGVDPASSDESSITLFRFGDEDEMLHHASRLSSEGKFQESVDLYNRVYDQGPAKSRHREEALLGLGNAYSNLLNPQKDYIQAALYFEKLIAEFPDSDLVPRAEKGIKKIQSLQSGATDR